MSIKMCCIKNTLVCMAVLEIVLDRSLLAQCGRVKRVIGAVDVNCGRIACSFSLIRYLVCGVAIFKLRFPSD